ncbi:MAG: T9SS type A sorting domain-containing protein [Bacteroidota bacterium]
MKKLYFLLILALGLTTVHAQVSVTFAVDMNEQTVSMDGVFATGNWMDDAGLGGEWQEPGSNMDAMLTDDDGDGVYTLTVSMAAGTYEMKYANGTGWANAEAGGGNDNYQADLEACDGIGNGLGGFNRGITVPAGDAYTVDIYLFNSCTESAVLNTDEVSTLGKVTIAPNPATDLLNVTFDNDLRADHVVSLFSLTGQLLTRVNLGNSNTLTLDVSNYPKGMYLLQFTNDKGETGTKKLMIK